MALSVRLTARRDHGAIDRCTPIDDLPEFLKVGEVAAYLGIGRDAAYALAQTHGFKFGRLVRVPREALKRLAGAAK